MSNASMQEHWSFVVDHVSHPYNKTGTMQVWCLVEAYFDISSLMLDFQILFSSKFMQDRAMAT